MAPVIDDDPTRLPGEPQRHAQPDAARRHWRANLRLTAILLVAWFAVGFVIPWNARDLGFPFFGWPFGFWVAAQGGTCAFLVLIVAYALGMRRLDRRWASGHRDDGTEAADPRATPDLPRTPDAPDKPGPARTPEGPEAPGAPDGSAVSLSRRER